MVPHSADLRAAAAPVGEQGYPREQGDPLAGSGGPAPGGKWRAPPKPYERRAGVSARGVRGPGPRGKWRAPPKPYERRAGVSARGVRGPGPRGKWRAPPKPYERRAGVSASRGPGVRPPGGMAGPAEAVRTASRGIRLAGSGGSGPRGKWRAPPKPYERRAGVSASWQVLGSNQRRLSRRFYRPLPLTTRATCRDRPA